MYEYLDYSSPLEYFEDVVVKYNAERPPNKQITVVEVPGRNHDPDVAFPSRHMIVINPNSRLNFHPLFVNFTSYSTF